MTATNRVYTGFPIVVTEPADVDTTEYELLDGALAGELVASKVAVYSSASQLALARQIQADGASVALTANMSGSLCVFDKTDGALFTLPAAAAGLFFDFAVVASLASGVYRIACTTGDFMLGSVLMDDGDSGLTTTAAAFNGSTHLALEMNATTAGGYAGAFIRLTAISASQWVIEGHILHTGNVASPAKTT